jgi:tetratricopeptide (TPR) repeat protein
MKRRFTLAALLLCAAAPPAPPPASPAAKPQAATPAPPPTAAQKLLAALKAAPDPQTAALLEARLQDAWHDEATPAVQILTDQATQLGQAGKLAEAQADCDAAIVLQPGLADLWRRRAEARFGQGDDRGAFADLAQALSREPRLIPAWADLSRFAEARHDTKRALAAWRKVMELDPKAEGGARRLDRLQHVVNGEPI